MSDYFVERYFDGLMLNRQRLLWAVATRRQLERWEPYVANAVRLGFEGRQPDGADIWAAAIEHHFTLIAARHLIRALEIPPATSVTLDETLRDELKEGRDLHEHWDDNMPVFNVLPRTKQPPRASGRNFAQRNPRKGPYDWTAWTNSSGALLLPHVSASALHRLLDDVEAGVLTDDATLAGFVSPRASSPWLHKNGEWWPKPDEAKLKQQSDDSWENVRVGVRAPCPRCSSQTRC